MVYSSRFFRLLLILSFSLLSIYRAQQLKLKLAHNNYMTVTHANPHLYTALFEIPVNIQKKKKVITMCLIHIAQK